MATIQPSLLSGTIWFLFSFTVVHSHLTCNFEVNTCGWGVSNGWIRGQGNASILDTGPRYDHSTNPDGFYLHLNARQLQPDEKAYVFSPPILNTKKKYCLSFYYLMHGKQVATLSVHVSNSSSTSNEVWATSFEHGPEWLHQEILIENGRQIIFEGVFGGELGDIAIDDTKIRVGDCKVKVRNEPLAAPPVSLPFKCDFEKGSKCGFHGSEFNFEDWEIGSGISGTAGTGPDHDHTFRTSKGHYLHVDASNHFFERIDITLVSPTFKTNKDSCVQFWYNMYGSGDYELTVDLQYNTVWSMKRSQGYGWQSAFISVKARSEFTLYFTLKTSSKREGDIAIDDISVQEGKCPHLVDCSFENTLCAWSNTGDDEFDWSTRTGKHQRTSLGPNVDHTLSSDKGTYMIIESKSQRKRDRAHLASTTITENVKTNCLKFWYNMDGKDVGELRIFIYNQNMSRIVWKLIGPQGGKWSYASVPIDPKPHNFWLVFEGVVGRPSQSYIAFDDISMTEGNCQTTPSKAVIGGGKVSPHLPISTPSITVNPRQIILSCDFTNNFCGWEQGMKDGGNWIRTNRPSKSPFTGPNGDHTSGKGGYIYVDSTSGSVGPIRLISPTIKLTNGNMCLKFWYFMFGQNVGELKVFINQGRNKNPDPHWMKSGSQAKKWIQGQFLFQAEKPFQIVFTASLSGAFYGDIDLDDILLIQGTCNAGEGITTPKPGITEKPIPIGDRNCDFESTDICGYEHVKGSSNYHWIRNSGDTDSRSTGPTFDHTTNTAEGYYMYIEGSYSGKGSVARMVTPLYQDTTSACLQFYYHMYGDGIGNFTIYALPKGNMTARQLIYKTTGDHGQEWAVDRVTIDKLTTTVGYKIMFEATRGRNYRADIAIDDVSFAAGECSFLGDCNFEDKTCTWENVKSDDFDWVLMSGQTPTPGTGPKSDHTLGNNEGHYMYIETSSPIKPGMNAQLVSALLPKIDDYMCLQFWFHMYGKTVDSLKIIIQVTGHSKTVIWQVDGDQGKEWVFARVPLSKTSSTYKILFEASSGADSTGNIAIDDISFTENQCQTLPVNARVTATSGPPITTPSPTAGTFHCNFDKDFCGWKQDEGDQLQWVRHRGPTPAMDTGPPSDHTSKKGYYIYMKVSGFSWGHDKARLISPDYTPDNTGLSCVSFWYYMYGADINDLNVYIQYGLMRPSLPTWSVSGDQGQRWIYGKFTVKSSRIFNVILEASSEMFSNGEIAIDDISISHGKCADYNNKLFKCDFETDSMCGFRQGIFDDYNWNWQSGHTARLKKGPTDDHTLGTKEGHYLYLDGNSKPSGSSTLTAPSIKARATSLCLQFYYQMSGSNGELSIKKKKFLWDETIWHQKVHQVNYWELASIQLSPENSKHLISIVGRIGGRGGGDIAIDDFSIQKGQCPHKGLCNFEDGICIWRNTKDDDFDWIIKKADESPTATGPAKDHTIDKLGSGHFLYVSSNGNDLHNRAVVESPDMDPKSQNCLHFWFISHGNDPGTLTVSQNTRGRHSDLWQMIGSNTKQWPQNGLWQEARIKIPRTNRIFTISIDVMVGRDGYIAIDDILPSISTNCSRIPSDSFPVITIPPPTTKKTVPPRKSTTPKPPASRVSCYFRHDLCDWTQDKQDDIDWIRKNGTTPTSDTGPSAVHKSASDFYIYIESSYPTKAGDVARLISPKFSLKTKNHHNTKCLTFLYNMYGRTIGSLSLLLLVNGKMGSPIWKRQKSQGKNWVTGSVNLHGSDTVQVVFEAISGNGGFGDIALDNIKLQSYPCYSNQPSLLPSCDFEGTCNYTSKSSNPWIITSSSNHLNIVDHTYNTTSGEFMYAKMTKSNYDTQIETPLLKPGQYCLEFFYRSINKVSGFIAVRTISNGLTTTPFLVLGASLTNQWTIAEINIKRSDSFTVAFDAYARISNDGMIAVDDVFFQNGKCPRRGSCDFERGHLCFWKNDPASNANWEVHTGKTINPKTGPSTDHTKGNQGGSYALLDSSSPAKRGDWGRLISQRLNNKNLDSCFTFWYSMNGADVASLSISLNFRNKAPIRYWILTGNQGKNWNFGQIPIPASKDIFQILIVGRVGGKNGDIGIDDILLSENTCGFHPRKARAYHPTTAHPVITTTNPPISSGVDTFNCTFEKGLCGWSQTNTDDFDWTRIKGYTPSRETGPQGDHTSGRGYYLYLEANGKRASSKAQLMFFSSNEKPGIKCMQFWYSMRGSNVGTLNVYVITAIESGRATWTKSGTQGASWNLGKVQYNATATIKIIIEGINGRGDLGDIAIDDITLQDGGCKEAYGDCDFEEIDRCGYKNDPKGDFKWERRHGNTESWETGPKADHTYGTYKGNYMYIDSSGKRKNETARLISPVYKALPDEHCLQFYYNMYGENVGALNVKIRIHDSDKKTHDTDDYLHINGNQGQGWKLAKVELQSTVTENPYQLIFEGVVGGGIRGDIAIDDVIINAQGCGIGGDCNFDFLRCTWVNVKQGDNFDWMVGSGKTSTPETGPLTDHTQQNDKGFYLFIDASSAKTAGQKAWYVSQDFTPTYGENRCINFWYSMNGQGVGTLRVVIKFENGRNNTLWELRRDQGNHWQFGQAPIKSPTAYKIIFEAVRGPDHRGDIAIDDILFTDFSCSVSPFEASPRGKKQTLPAVTGTTPATHTPEKSLNCTFDLGTCGWTQSKDDQFDWIENKGGTPEAGTGPSHDHSKNGKGFYFYIDSMHHYRSEKARLVSPSMRPNGLQCFTVWYHMFGSNVGSFNIYVFTGPKLSNPVFRRYQTAENKWLRADVQFNSKSPYNIILEASAGGGRKGDIAIDDVSLVDGHCVAESIGNERLCTFETDKICSYTHDPAGNFKWQRSSYSKPSLEDHTYGTRSGRWEQVAAVFLTFLQFCAAGHYMYVFSYVSKVFGQFGRLSTPVYSVNSTDFCVEFWYHMAGTGIGQLTISYLSNKDNFKSATPIWTRDGPQGRRWLQGLVDINLKKEDISHIQIKFDGVIGPAYWNVIALDDVTLSTNVCKRNRGACTFEMGTCNWLNTNKDDFDWTIGSGLTTSTKSGPLKDHSRAMQGGSYLYIESDSAFAYDSSNSRKVAILESEIFEKSQQKCFQFYYLMKGARDGRVEVHVQEEGSKTTIPLWQLEGDQSKNWTLAQMELPTTALKFQVIIKGFRGPRFQGQIAIDDLEFSNTSNCDMLPTKAKIISVITTTPAPTTPAPIDGFDCTFDKNFCKWIQFTSRWKRVKKIKNGPSADHTGDGFYVFLDSSQLKYNSYGTLVSPIFPISSQRCFSFYYYMSGEDLNTLSVGLKRRVREEYFWERIGPQGEQWIHASVNIPGFPDNNHGSIVIKGRGPKYGASGFMAFDDVSIKPGECQKPKNNSKIDCDFENSHQCGYTQDSNDYFNWTYASGRRIIGKGNQPTKDHTYGTGFGHYMYLDSAKRSPGETAILWTPEFNRKEGSCLSFWYRMSGAGIGALRVRFVGIKGHRPLGPPIWARNGHQSENWIQEYIPIQHFNTLYVLFHGVAGKNPGGIAIDDIKLLPSCIKPGDCTFEMDSCGWRNVRGNDLDWQRKRLGHISFNRRLPSIDHTTNGAFGHIMYFSSHRFTNPGKKADLISVSFDPTSVEGLCFQFWFIIDGYKFGNLTVFKQTNSTKKTTMWQWSESRTRTWTQGSFHIKSSESYQIIFRAVKGTGSNGYIALDDINYSTAFCTVSPKEAKPRIRSTLAPPTTQPTTTAQHSTLPPSPYDCSFENNFCQWTQGKEDDFDWKIGTGYTNKDYTGPLVDHTLRTKAGHFAYIQSTWPRKPNDTARLVSPKIGFYGPACLSFWYHMYGEHIRTLNIYATHSSTKLYSPVWSRSGTLNRQWYAGQMYFYSQPSFTNIIFEAIRGEGYKGDIALDDIRVKKGYCPETGKSCDFEDDSFCNYQQSGSDNFDWSIGNASVSVKLPRKDHTYKTSAGNYMFVFGKHPAKSKAQIFGPIMPHTFGYCIRFWYSLSGPIRLNIYSVSDGHDKMLANYKSNSRTDWTLGYASVKSYSTWQMMFEANVTANSPSSYIAIDDVKLTKGSCGMSGDCTFENDACRWINLGNDNFDWIIKSAGSGHSGPVIDHTLQLKDKGSYFFIDGSSQKTGDKAILKHIYMSLDQQRLCLQFWYSMHGGELQIKMGNGKVLWRLYADHGANILYEWKYAQVPLPKAKVYTMIMFVGTIDSGAVNYIAIDDVLFQPATCTRLPADADPTHTRPTTVSTTPVPVTPSVGPRSIYDCTFETGFCSWRQSMTDNFNWTRWHGRTDSSWTGPNTDHTTGKGSGWFIYIESSRPQKKGDRAILVSRPFQINTKYCFKFYYHMHGYNFGELNVIQTNKDGTNRTLWTKIISRGQSWVKEEFKIPKQNQQFTISFEGNVRSSTGDIALDDIKVNEGNCPETGPLNCTFESAYICGYKSPVNHGAQWKPGSGNKMGRLTGRFDEDQGSIDGIFMYLEWDTKDQKFAKAQLISPTIKTSTDLCMTFYYKMYYRTRGDLRIYQQIGNTLGTPSWIRFSKQGLNWIKGQVTLPAHQDYKVVFEGNVENYNGSIQIDDITTTPGLCADPGNCNFEQVQCTWSHMRGDKIHWIMATGASSMMHIGPSIDHTTHTDKGHFMLLEASYASKGTKGGLRSETFPPTTARCMHFWYSMEGEDIGGLKIYFVSEKSGNKTAIWYLQGDQGNKWNSAQVAFAWTDANYVIIEGIRGSGDFSAIAIDDIVFTQDYCATLPTYAQTEYVFPKAASTTPSPTWSPTAVDCSFENKCSWTQSKDDDFNWELAQGRAGTVDTGPPNDHTLGTSKGHYIFIETSLPRKPNDIARFESPTFVPTKNGCLRFWYYMYGPDVDTLTVYMKDSGKLIPKWTKTGNIDAAWKMGIVPIQSDKKIQIVFEGRRGPHWLGDIALDDIAFSYNGCPSSADMVCGFEKSDICGFQQSKKDDLDWQWFAPGTSHATHHNDHTLDTIDGHYMLVSGGGSGEKAVLTSPLYKSNISKCIEFWYLMYGKKPGTLTVYSIEKGTRLNLWSRIGNQGDVWSKAEMTVRSSGTFNLEIEAVVDKPTGNIAIDDFGMFHGDCSKHGNCDFEKGWCTWNNDRTDDFDWQIGTGYLGIFGAPRQDHTTDSITGHFIFLKADFPIKAGARAVLTSEIFEGTYHKCMTFWYFVKEAGTATVNVYFWIAGKKTLGFSLSGSQPEESWRYAQIPIPHKQQGFQIVIEGIKGMGNRINIAIDDITLTDWLCPLFPMFTTTVRPTGIPTTTPHLIETTPVATPFDCTFEKGWCQWTQDKSDEFDWIRSQGAMGSNFKGPLKDHTSGTDNGWYIFTDSSRTTKPSDEARLIGPKIVASTDRCLNFWYHMYGAYLDTLSVYLYTNDNKQKIWQRHGHQGSGWKEAYLDLPAKSSTTYKIVFGSGRSSHAHQQIALDDIRFTKNKCHENNPYFCDFEDMCGYKQLPTDDFEWSWGSGRTPTFLTGPVVDHTTETKFGHYMFIESSKKKPNQKAHLVSPKYNTTDTKCLQFYYYMYGDYVGSLNVYRVDGEHFDEIGTPIWSRKYNMGSIWVEGQTTIYPGDNYHILFEGITGKGELSDIAIDDISLTNGPCQLSGFCDFEKDLCTWKNIDRDQFDWVRSSGSTQTADTGPVSDHTLGTVRGSYIYIETSSPQTPGDVARLQSEDFRPSTGSVCLRFWYQMNGEHVNTLNVLVRNVGEKGEGYVWSQNGDNGPHWLFAQLNVDNRYTNKPYHFIIEGVRGEGTRGDIAVDDIDVSTGECQIVPPYADPKQIALYTVKCSFDDGTFCNFEQRQNDDFDWQITNKPSSTYRSGPRADHSGSGYYIYLVNHRRVMGYKAALFTPTLGPTTGEGNCFTFYYHMFGVQIGTLNIYTIINKKKTLHWTKSGEQGEDWKHGHFNIKSKFNYQIYIEGVSSGGYHDVMALDDIVMDANPCAASRVCDFTVNMCGWTNEDNYKPWVHATTPTPIPDHDTGTAFGGILYSNATASKEALAVSRVVTPSYPSASRSCLKFWFYMDGQNPGELDLLVKLPYETKRIWGRKGAQGDRWWMAYVDVGEPKVHLIQTYKFIFDAVQKTGPHINGFIAIDDVEHLPGPCTINGVCDFEQDLCGFSNIKGDELDWMRVGGKPSIGADHSLKTYKGHFMIIKGEKTKANTKGWLASWNQEKTPGKCLKFWYNMHGWGVGKLNILIMTAKGKKNIWSKSESTGPIWMSASVTLISDHPFWVLFEGVQGVNYTNAVGIDDIQFLEGSCETQTTPSIDVVTPPTTPASMLMCDFEQSLCGWKQDTTDNSDWIRTTAKKAGRPKMDHTKDNDEGGFISVKSSSVEETRIARLMSDAIYQDKVVCLTFWYHMNGEYPGTLNIYVQNIGDNKPPVWKKVGAQGLNWRYAQIEIAKPEKQNRIYFEAKRGMGYGDISLDDISLLLDKCPPMDSCDFEEPDICGFEQGDNDVFDWTWGSANTPSYRTGPKNDHTYGTKFGHYMYIETSDRSVDDHAHLYSPVYRGATQEQCLTFWYNMHGHEVAKLKVYLYQNNKIGDLIWSLQMDQGEHWHLATVTINSETPFQVLFEGIRGKGVLGDIAIDDVKLSKEACDPVAFCTFEEGICGWENLADIGEADYDWQRTEAKSLSSNRGPPVDHTIGEQSGFYLLINDELRRVGSARLRSQTIPLLPNNPKSYCFQFWYNTYGTHVGQLDVKIHYHGEPPETVWGEIPTNNTRKPQWRQAMVLIEDPYSHFEIIVDGVAGIDTDNYIALDDLQILPGICPNMEVPQFTCKSGKKINSTSVCDFIKDCPDFDDEANCGNCDFEDSLCTWKNVSPGVFNWKRNQGGLSDIQTKMHVDHTTNTSKGWYVFANAYQSKYGEKAVLRNRVLQQTSATCELTYWSYRTGHNIGRLMLNVLEGGKTTKMAEIHDIHFDRWEQYTVDMRKISTPFKLEFVATGTNIENGLIAVDDIKMEDCFFPVPKESCAKTEFQCASKGCIDKSRICDISDDCGDRSDESNCGDFMSCDFENSLCNWSQDRMTDDFDWTRLSGATDAYQSGPNRDHSKGTASGYYIYAESSRPRRKKDKTRFISPLIEPPGNKECWIRFFYHMRGVSMGGLNLYTRTSVFGNYQKVWSKKGALGDVWLRADVKLFSVTYFQAVFEVVVGGPSSDIAIDDITFTPGCRLAGPKVKLPNGTKSEPDKDPCGTGLFHCKSSECVLQSKVCDFTKDCKDGSDEDICGTCDFEKPGNCGWTDRTKSSNPWQNHQGKSPGKFGPRKDHTTNSETGKYMMVIGVSKPIMNNAYLETRPLGATRSSCQAEFYVFMMGKAAGMISLFVIDPVTRKVKKQVAQVTGDKGNNWKKVVGNIGAQPAGFALQFRAVYQFVDDVKQTDVAIDDVRLLNCGPEAEPSKSPVASTSPSVISRVVTRKSTPRSSSPRSSSPKTPKVCGKGSFTCPTAPHLCIPSAFLCDGHADCPDNDDEKDCGICPKGQTYCIPRKECIISHRCDGIWDCADGSDETACKECQDGYCLNGGKCQMVKGSAKCLCKDKDVNFRCQVYINQPQESTKSKKKAWTIPLAIVLSVLFVGIIVGALYILWNRRRRQYSPNIFDSNHGVQNPAYDYGANLPAELNLSENLDPMTFDEPTWNIAGNGNSFKNPFYSED